MDDLQNDILTAVRQTRKNARFNYYAAYVTAAITVGASIGSTVLIGIDAPKSLTGTLAWIPAERASANAPPGNPAGYGQVPGQEISPRLY